MGYPMAGHLVKAGYQVNVYNRTSAVAERWIDEYQSQAKVPVQQCMSPRDASSSAQFVFMCVGNDDDVRGVTYGEEGVLTGMRTNPGLGKKVLVDHTTASAVLAIELAKTCADQNIGFIDAPVSGGQAGAENGALTVMCGGDEDTFNLVEPTIAAYAKKCALLGPAGSGQLTKMVNQICIAGVLQGLAEGVQFAQLAGLNVDDVVAVIAEGAAQSWQMNNRAHTMARDEFDFGFAVDWMRKDLGIALDTGRNLGAKLPLTALVDQFYGDVQAQGGGRWDTSSLLRRLTKIPR